MRRTSLLVGALLLAGAGSLNAQALTMQMSNGWMFSFSGNVNAFMIYQTSKPCDATGCNGTSAHDFSFGTGLLPAFATFAATGKEGNVDLGVHFGFAPQVEFGGHNASYFGTDAAGAQIDMRQVYLTAGGTWGQLLMGKELGLFQRGNILNDMTLLGVGVGGGGRGTALGRIGYGYLYTDFRPQLTYSSASGKPASFAVGLFEPIRSGPYTVASVPRLEAELGYNKSNFKFFINGAVQSMKDGFGTGTHSLTAGGVGGGAVVTFGGLALHASGFYASGMGFLLMGDGIVGGNNFDNGGTGAVDADGKASARTSYGFIGQATFSPKDSKWMFGGSYGMNQLDRSSEDKTADGIDSYVLKEDAIVGQITFKWTKSLRWVAEFAHITGHADGAKSSQGDQGSLGMMLFY
ncbi:MAG TPA: hypothetical protein VJN95_12935 [Gemmatimonadales bacterium]|nr:hypothetical protein [Gemmatimonadales bacterium]